MNPFFVICTYLFVLECTSTFLPETCLLRQRASSCCQQVFPTTDQCSNYPEFEKQCRVTCNDCHSYECSNPVDESTFPCHTQDASLCNDSMVGGFLRKNCPNRCGTCPTSKYCKNVASDAFCRTAKKLCNSTGHIDDMTKLCPSTCNRCPSNSTSPPTPNPDPRACVDNANDCASRLWKCKTSEDEMRKDCQLSCGLCCTDSPKCQKEHRFAGVCSSNDFTEPERRQLCPVTCDFC